MGRWLVFPIYHQYFIIYLLYLGVFPNPSTHQPTHGNLGHLRRRFSREHRKLLFVDFFVFKNQMRTIRDAQEVLWSEVSILWPWVIQYSCDNGIVILSEFEWFGVNFQWMWAIWSDFKWELWSRTWGLSLQIFHVENATQDSDDIQHLSNSN